MCVTVCIRYVRCASVCTICTGRVRACYCDVHTRIQTQMAPVRMYLTRRRKNQTTCATCVFVVNVWNSWILFTMRLFAHTIYILTFHYAYPILGVLSVQYRAYVNCVLARLLFGKVHSLSNPISGITYKRLVYTTINNVSFRVCTRTGG